MKKDLKNNEFISEMKKKRFALYLFESKISVRFPSHSVQIAFSRFRFVCLYFVFDGIYILFEHNNFKSAI